jgi:hypothetical protein
MNDFKGKAFNTRVGVVSFIVRKKHLAVIQAISYFWSDFVESWFPIRLGEILR